MAANPVSPFRLRHGRGRVLEPFLNRIHGERAIQQVIWVSPWMTHLPFLGGDTHSLLDALQSKGTQLTVVTREPDDDPHSEFVADVCCLANSEVFFLKDLHAKYYICHTPRQSYAVVGSPNLYKWTAKSYELGIMIEACGDGEELISQLETVTLELKTADTRVIFKRRGKGVER